LARAGGADSAAGIASRTIDAQQQLLADCGL
jgi:hypothetical protein